MIGDPLVVVSILVRLFDHMGIRYVVGGSLASSVYGIPRATQDADFMAEIDTPHVDALGIALENDFYVATELITEAIRHHSFFNVIHLATMFKADIFVARGEDWEKEEMSRAHTETFAVSEAPVSVRFSSPEDVVLHKLLWYQLGGNVSDQQWRDVLGVLKVQGASLDNLYLDRWAKFLHLSDLLALARNEL